MKNLVLIFSVALIILNSCTGNAGSKEECDNSKKEQFATDDSKICVIEPIRFANFYTGIENIFTLHTNVEADSFQFETNTPCEIRSDNDNYFIRSNTPNERFLLKTYAIKNETRTLINSSNIKFKSIPNGTPMVSDCIDGDKINKENLINTGLLTVQLINMDTELRYEIVGFTICTYKNSRMIENKSLSEAFTNDQIKQIKELSSGDKIYFENILAKAPDETIRNHGTIMLIIK